jgi:hypothetical protein
MRMIDANYFDRNFSGVHIGQECLEPLPAQILTPVFPCTFRVQFSPSALPLSGLIHAHHLRTSDYRIRIVMC